MAWDNAYTANKEIALKSGGRFCEYNTVLFWESKLAPLSQGEYSQIT